ncbi:MAG: exonuclease domain-containing protein, partial [Clostridium sp.]|nr:exonuclease domain-containing protein [Clostridium sp.]
MKIICMDAETTDRGEMLELSVFSFDGSEIYHHYFKPANARRWRTDIHHITPAMVADKPTAARCLPRIQSVIDDATHILGFAVDNDIRILEHSGVRRFERKRVIEVRQWYW